MIRVRQPGFRGDKLVFEFSQPGRMGKVPSADHGNPLLASPQGEVFQVTLLARRP